MSVIIEPAEQLEFHSPFTRISKESLLVKNPGNQPVIFKVKTTAPKQYCVRPNAGRIEPNSEIEVQIILQPFKEEPAEDYKCKDKFLVQTAPILNTFEQQDVTSMWSYVESAERASMHQHKIRCVFSGPREENEEATGINEEKVSTVPPIPESGNSDGIASSPTTTTTTTTTAPIVPIAPTEVVHDIPKIQTTAASTDSLPSPISRDIPAVPVHHEEKSIPTVVPIVPAVDEPTPIAHPEPVVSQEQPKTELPTVAASVLPTSQKQPEQQPEPIVPQPIMKRDIVDNSTPFSIHSTNDKETELKDALEKIKLLEQRLHQFEQQQKEEGLRARNNNGRKLASSVQPLDAVHQHLAALEKPRADEGYPPQVVMIVAAVVFIFTYMFF